MNENAKIFKLDKEIIKKVDGLIGNAKKITDLPFSELSDVDISIYLKEEGYKDTLDQDGIAAIDFDFSSTSNENSLALSSALYYVVNNNLFSPAQDKKNNTPFSVMKGVEQNREKMEKAGVKYYTPETKLGFHNDVLYHDGEYTLPNYVSLMNLFIGYKEPGNFYFITIDQWKEFKTLFDQGKDLFLQYKPTPQVYESSLETDNPISSKDWSKKKVPVFWEDTNGKKHAFYNGEFENEDHNELVQELKRTLSETQTKYQVPQKNNCMIIFRNDRGFHARDIFQEQFIFEGITRMFLRSVSIEGVDVPQIAA